MTVEAEQIVVWLTAISILIGGMVWLIRAVNSIHKQTEFNGGTSMRDQINRIEGRQVEIQQAVHDARVEFHSHINWHMDHLEKDK